MYGTSVPKRLFLKNIKTQRVKYLNRAGVIYHSMSTFSEMSIDEYERYENM